MANETVRPMTTGQFRDIAATMIGAIPDDLSFDDAQQGVIGEKGTFVAAIRQIFEQRRVRQEPAAPTPPSPLLSVLGTLTLPAATDPFVTRDKFVVNTGRKARVKIAWLGDNFKSWFLGKVEEPAAEITLRSAKLLRSSVDEPIRAELKDTAETTLAEMFSLLERQPSGERGTLLNDGRANIFYILDVAGVLRAVYVSWYGDGWSVNADAVDYPFAWFDGDQVFSRNSLVAQTV